MTELKEFLEKQFRMLDRGFVGTPSTREELETFAKANNGSSDLLLMQMAMNFGYKIAMENVKEIIEEEVAQ